MLTGGLAEVQLITSTAAKPQCPLLAAVPKAAGVGAKSSSVCQVPAGALSRGSEAAVLTCCGSIGVPRSETSKEEKPTPTSTPEAGPCWISRPFPSPREAP